MQETRGFTQLDGERKRLSIAMQQLYAALLMDKEAREGSDGETFASLLDAAVVRGLITPSAAAQVRSLAYAKLRVVVDAADDAEEALDDEEWDVPWFPEPGEHPSAGLLLDEDAAVNLLEAAEQIGVLAKRICGQIPVGRTPELTRPPVLDSWTPLPQALEALAGCGGYAAVRDSSGYCVLLSQQDVGAWFAQTPSPLPDPSMVSAADLLECGREQWSAVDASVPIEEVEALLSDWSARITAVLVFSNEDYAGDPVGLVTTQTFQEWQRAFEKRRRMVGALFEAEINGPDFTAETGTTTGTGLDALAKSLGCDLLYIDGSEGLERAMLVALTGSTSGLAPRELVDVMLGQRTARIVSRGLASLPVFGCAHAMDSGSIEHAIARLISIGAVRRTPGGALVLSGAALTALVSADPAASVTAVLAHGDEGLERGGEA